MEQYMVWIWLGITVAAIVAEIASVQLISIWFAAAGALSIAFCFIPGFPWWGQVIIFVVLSSALLVFLRPLCNKYLLHRHMATNTDSLIGRDVRMITEANFDQLGQAKVGDVVWSIKSKDDTPLLVGDIVTIVAIDGNKLIAEHKTE